MNNLTRIFLEEGREYLERLDQNIVRLENEPDNRELIDEIFRAFHTLKGNAGLVGMQKFEKTAHVTEGVLAELRDQERTVTAELITFLLEALDRLKILHEAIEKTGEDAVDIGEFCTFENGSQEAGTSETDSAQDTEVSDQSSEIRADDGSWGLFPENVQSDQQTPEEQQDAGPDRDPPSEKMTAGPPVPPQVAAPAEEAALSWSKPETVVRVPVGLLDSLMNLMGELVLARNQVLQSAAESDDSAFQATCQRLNLVTTELQENVMQTRMQPVGNIFNRFPRIVRDVMRAAGKKVDLQLDGQETELDKTIIEGIRDPLMHLVRNAVDHGIEDEETRSRLGKPPHGTLIMRAYHEGGQVNIEILDDGKGIDPHIIKRKAVERGLISAQRAASLSDRDILNLIFEPGFSTAETVTNLSGRGVGMDVVRTNIEKIGGSVEVFSERGVGTTIKIKIPLTLAIIPALIVTAGAHRFAIPQINLVELVLIAPEEARNIECVADAEVYRLRDKLLPVLRLQRLLHLPAAENAPECLSMVVLAAGAAQFGLLVDEIHDTEEIVVKPLSNHLKHISAYAGATVMGDGRVALILDAVGLAGMAQLTQEDMNAKAAAAAGSERVAAQTHSLLLFSLDRERKQQLAVPLSLVSRLETFPAGALQRAGNREVVCYRDKVLPLLRIDNHLDLAAELPEDTFSVLVFAIDQHDAGLIVAEILDTIDTSAKIDTSYMQSNGLLGSVILDGEIILIIDAYAIVAQEFPSWFGKRHKRDGTRRPELVKRLLLAEDSSFVRSIEKSYLESAGYTVVEAKDGAEALDKLSANDFDLVITDVEMPQMDGLELTRCIRGHKNLRDIPVIMLSSLRSETDIRRGLEAGADAYLVKLDQDELLDTLDRISREVKARGAEDAGDGKTVP